jgi:hypothetical protein
MPGLHFGSGAQRCYNKKQKPYALWDATMSKEDKVREILNETVQEIA